jgi:hypothetical protein
MTQRNTESGKITPIRRRVVPPQTPGVAKKKHHNLPHFFSAAAPDADIAQDWPCPVASLANTRNAPQSQACTYLNWPTVARCHLCRTKRPAASSSSSSSAPSPWGHGADDDEEEEEETEEEEEEEEKEEQGPHHDLGKGVSPSAFKPHTLVRGVSGSYSGLSHDYSAPARFSALPDDVLERVFGCLVPPRTHTHTHTHVQSVADHFASLLRLDKASRALLRRAPHAWPPTFVPPAALCKWPDRKAATRVLTWVLKLDFVEVPTPPRSLSLSLSSTLSRSSIWSGPPAW